MPTGTEYFNQLDSSTQELVGKLDELLTVIIGDPSFVARDIAFPHSTLPAMEDHLPAIDTAIDAVR